jgi:hypothetical protein
MLDRIDSAFSSCGRGRQRFEIAPTSLGRFAGARTLSTETVDVIMPEVRRRFADTQGVLDQGIVAFPEVTG